MWVCERSFRCREGYTTRAAHVNRVRVLDIPHFCGARPRGGAQGLVLGSPPRAEAWRRALRSASPAHARCGFAVRSESRFRAISAPIRRPCFKLA